MVAVNWCDQRHAPSVCPVCDNRDGKLRFLEILPEGNGSGGNRVISLLRCPGCDCCYCDPMDSVDYETADAGGLKYYLEQGAGIETMLEPLSLIDGRPITRFLEIGCSFGFVMDYAHRMLGWKVRGFDPGAIAAAGTDLLGLDIASTYLERPRLEDGAADLVLCSEVIEHITDPNSFVELLRLAAGDRGLLLLTTPNSDALSPTASREVITSILSPGQHVVLYNAASMETLLKRNGFGHLQVADRGNQLYVVASPVPLSGVSRYFDRSLYCRYLEGGAGRHTPESSLGAGYAYRLLKEHVNSGRYSEGKSIVERLRESYLRRYGLNIEVPGNLELADDNAVSFEEFGNRWPFNLCGVFYYYGMIKLADEKQPQLAEALFGAASKFGTTFRRVLAAIGAEDLETDDLCRNAEIHQLVALAQYDASRAVERFRHFSTNPHAIEPAVLAAHLRRAASRLFTDLVSQGRYSLAQKMLESEALSDELSASHGCLSTKYAYAMYVLNHESDFTKAGSLFGQVWQGACADSIHHPLLWPARFHEGLAKRRKGDYGAAKIIRQDLLHARSGSSEVPHEYVERLNELMEPTA